MKTESKDFSHLLKEEHYGKWLVVSKDYSKILGFSEDLKQLTGAFEQKSVIYTRALDPRVVYAF